MKSLNRREFLNSLSAATALTALSTKKSLATNDKIVIGIMGLGGRGVFLAEKFVQRLDVEIAYLCDVDQRRFTYAREVVGEYQDKEPKLVQDFRKILDDPNVDALINATPDHWHALGTIMACQAGKDVYVEKPLCVTAWEGIKMVEAARKYNRVVQVGSQTRSASYVKNAADYMESGKLGDIHITRVFSTLDRRDQRPKGPEEAVPEGFDYDMWCGPAPKYPYRPGHWWGHLYDFSCGSIANDAYHQLDLARWMLNKPFPNSACSAGGVQFFKDDREIPDTQLVTYDYDELTLHLEATLWTPYFKKTPSSIRDSDQFPTWEFNSSKIEVLGTEGFLRLGRQGGGWQVFGPEGEMVVSESGRQADNEHISNFIDCIRSRKKPNADVEEGRRSALLIHLANLSSRLGNQKLIFNSDMNIVTNVKAANNYLRRKDRKPWVIPNEV